MKQVKRLSFILIVFSLFFAYLVTTASAQQPPGPPGPPGAPGAEDAPTPDPNIISDEEDHCQSMPDGDEKDECYLEEDEDAGPDDAHCEELHKADGPPLWEPSEEEIAGYEKEYRENMKTGQGRLNEPTIAAIMSHGLSRQEVDCHVEEFAQAAAHDAEANEKPPAEAIDPAQKAAEGGAPGQPGAPGQVAGERQEDGEGQSD